MSDRFDLPGRRGLVLDVANEHSIAYGFAQALHEAGVMLAITYLGFSSRNGNLRTLSLETDEWFHWQDALKISNGPKSGR
jgi:enoyl-[acyl-carrier-protein] reductase (NADH)